jgi:hypothetical protein
MGRKKDTEEQERSGGSWLKVILAFSGIAFIALMRRKTEPAPLLPVPEDKPHGEYTFRRKVLHGWIIVCAVAILFVLYGFFAFFVIGDKGQPDWDYGSVEDVPAQSVYSTYPYRGRVVQPEPQHVNERPSAAQGALPGRNQPVSPDTPVKEGQ